MDHYARLGADSCGPYAIKMVHTEGCNGAPRSAWAVGGGYAEAAGEGDGCEDEGEEREHHGDVGGEDCGEVARHAVARASRWLGVVVSSSRYREMRSRA